MILFNIFAYLFSTRIKKFSFTMLSLLSTAFILMYNSVDIIYIKLFIYLIGFFTFKHFFNLIYNNETTQLTLYESVQSYGNFWSILTVLPIPLTLIKKKSVSKDNLSDVQWSATKLLIITMLWASFFNLLIFKLNFKEMSVQEMFNFRIGSAYDGFYILEKKNTILTKFGAILIIGLGVFTKIFTTSNYAISLLRLFGYNLPSTVNSNIYKFNSLRGFLGGAYYYYNYLLINIILPRVKIITKFLNFNKFLTQNLTIVLLFTFGGISYSVFNAQFYNDFLKAQAHMSTYLLYLGVYFIPLSALILISRHFGLLKIDSHENFHWRLFKKLIIVFIFFCLLLIKTSIKYQNWNIDNLINFFSLMIGSG